MLAGAFLTRGAFVRLFPVFCLAATRPSKSRSNCSGVAVFATDFMGSLPTAFFRTIPDINRVSITCQTQVHVGSPNASESGRAPSGRVLLASLPESAALSRPGGDARSRKMELGPSLSPIRPAAWHGAKAHHARRGFLMPYCWWTRSISSDVGVRCGKQLAGGVRRGWPRLRRSLWPIRQPACRSLVGQ
jgi:hypothetical protein